jgi:16S rRNA (guanine527-N7)-methyltransferase
VKHLEPSNSVGAQVRKVVERAPELAQCGLGTAFLDRIRHFADILALWGTRTNLTAHPDDPTEVAFHVVDSLAPLYAFPSSLLLRKRARVLDLGSGAGFPGLVLAAAIDADFILIEARRKRASFLSAAENEMALTNINVECCRATAATVSTNFDALTSRAVGEACLGVAARALHPSGVAILWVGRGQKIELKRAQALGFGEVSRHEYTVKRGSDTIRRSLLTLRKSAPP